MGMCPGWMGAASYRERWVWRLDHVGVEAARRTGLYVLATLKKYLGSLDRVERIVKTFGMVNANPETIKGSECITIINGFSNLMMEVFGPEKGVGARSAVGLATLPHNCPVEVECVFQIKKDVSFNKYC